MFRTVLLVLLLSMFPNYVQNGNKDREKSSEKLNFVWQLPSLLSGLLSLMFNTKHSKKIFCVFLSTVVLTLDVTLVYMYLCHSASRQKGQDHHQLPPIRVTTKCLNSTDDDNFTKKYDSNYLYQSSIVSYKEEEKQMTWKSEHNDTADDYDITSKDRWACPWYLNFTPARSPVVASVYPLEGYFKEILDNNPQTSLMKYEWARLQSFKQFPKESPAFPIRLAQVGFYFTGYKDNVTCFSCNAEYGSWKEEDIPIHVHKRLNPACKFITGKDTSNIPIHDNNGPIDPNPEEDMGATGGSIYTDGGSAENHTSVELKQQCDTKPAGSSSCKQNGAKHPEYADFAKRESTYKDWPCSHIVSPKLLTEAGFVYAGVGDCVRCYFCGIGLRNWDCEDGPWEEHARWSQNCQYLLDKKGLQFVRMHKLQADEVVEELTVNAPPVSKAKKQDEIQDHCKNKTKANVITKKTDKTPEMTRSKTPEPSTKKESKEIKEENWKLKSQLTCKVCMDKPTDTVLLPCGHLVTCQTCSLNLRKCAICRTRIKARLRAFMS